MRRQISADELAALYHEIGACIWQMQYLEDALHTFLTMKIELKEPGRIAQKEAMELLAKHRRATLGTALKTAETAGALTSELIEQLRSLKADRDWLVHRSMHENGADLYTDHGRDAIFARLDDIQNRTIRLKASVVGQLETFFDSHDLSASKANAMARQQIDELRGEG